MTLNEYGNDGDDEEYDDDIDDADDEGDDYDEDDDKEDGSECSQLVITGGGVRPQHKRVMSVKRELDNDLRCFVTKMDGWVAKTKMTGW